LHTSIGCAPGIKRIWPRDGIQISLWLFPVC